MKLESLCMSIVNDIKALPQIFENYFLSRDLAHNYNARSKSNKNYFRDFVRTNAGKNSLKFKGVQLWNKMPSKLKSFSAEPPQYSCRPLPRCYLELQVHGEANGNKLMDTKSDVG